MKSRLTLAFLACGLAVAGVAAADPDPARHHHHHDAAGGEKLGHVSFPTSCESAVQPDVERGVALLHSFGYTEARAQFEAIAGRDPRCAMAHWGIAMTYFQEIWEPPDRKSLATGAAEMAKARALLAPPAKPLPRERAYVEALSAYFEPGKVPLQRRAEAYEARMDALHAQFPDDVEGAAFDALSILASEPPDDRSLSHEHRALAILQPLFALHPEHPGLAHYIIHTCDTPSLAPEGLPAAKLYAKIAPSSPHALHMPAHIFARLGMWQEDIDSNLASVAASKRAEAAAEPGAAHQMHADQFLIYAYLQVGEDEKARDLVSRMGALGNRMAAMPGMDDMKEAGHGFDNQLRVIYAMEMHQWDVLAHLKPGEGSKPWEVSDIYWGEAVAAGHTSDATLAAAALKGYEEYREALKHSPYAENIGSGSLMRNEILGWQALTEGHRDEAVADLRKAADEQDRVGQNEVDIPAREMLGDVLLLEHRPQEALAAYRRALELSPNRLNALLSAAQAAQQAGLPEEARRYDLLISQQTHGGADTRRPEVAQAVAVASGTAAR
ncbi:MAG TPA: tetratricopeptide repeat protein [Steroidobacteraceae bacterium]|nr:tetratricopeptide repeat protein [Steroidobacteraceae bacterium]